MNETTVIHGVRPWQSTDAELDTKTKRTALVYTDQREIEICLNCPYPTCHNCLDAWKNAFGNIRNVTYRPKKGKKKCSCTKHTRPVRTGLPTAKTTSALPKPEQYSVWDFAQK